MNPRRLAIALGIALAVSVAGNLFAATAAWTVLTGRDRTESRQEASRTGERRPTLRDLLAELDPETRRSVRQALREAGARARPDFQEARRARRAAVAAAAEDPYDPDRVGQLLQQSREAEARGRQALETETVTLLGTLDPADRATMARILNMRSRGGSEKPAPTGPGTAR